MTRTRRRSTLNATAHHEAGHAIMRLKVGLSVRKVSIVPEKEDNSLGRCEGSRYPVWFNPEIEVDTRSRLYIENNVLVLYAGLLAEARFTGRRNHIGASQDYRTAVNLAGYACGSDEELSKYLAWLFCRAKAVIDNNPFFWPAVTDLAADLMNRREISGRQVRSLYHATVQRVIAERSATRLPCEEPAP